MDIALEIKAKHGFLYKYLKNHNMTIQDLADGLGISYQSLCDYISFRRVPAPGKTVATKFENYFHVTFDMIFPPELTKKSSINLRPKRIVYQTIDNERLSYDDIKMLTYDSDEDSKKKLNNDEELIVWNENPEIDCIKHQEFEILMKIAKKILSERNLHILIDSIDCSNFRELGREYNLTGSRIQEIVRHSENKLYRAYHNYMKKNDVIRTKKSIRGPIEQVTEIYKKRTRISKEETVIFKKTVMSYILQILIKKEYHVYLGEIKRELEQLNIDEIKHSNISKTRIYIYLKFLRDRLILLHGNLAYYILQPKQSNHSYWKLYKIGFETFDDFMMKYNNIF